MDEIEIAKNFTSISASYYGIILSFNVALFGAAAFLFNKHLESYKKFRELLLPFLIAIILVISTVLGLLLFKNLQEIILFCKPKPGICDYKFDSQRCLLNSQIILLLIDLCLMAFYAFKIRKR